MFTKTLLAAFLICLCCLGASAQQPNNEAEADAKSYALYNAGNWQELLTYGKDALEAGIDFPLLRMRIGYAALMTGNYSLSLKHYQQVLSGAPGDETALYYCYLNNTYLNNRAASRFYASKLAASVRESEKLSSLGLSTFEVEYGIKSPTLTDRDDAQYGRAGVSVNLGYKAELTVSGAFYNQVISEPGYGLAVRNNRNIDIRQVEGYGKLRVTPVANLSVIGAFHYLNTPFNNFVYNNMIGYGALRYTTPYAAFQAGANIGNIGDSSFQQFDGSLSLYPLGNLNLYTISKVMFVKDATFAQVIGARVMKGLWLEGNVLIGTYRTLLDNEALYLYNDVDTKKLRAGASVYVSLGKHLLASVNYTFDQKERIFTKYQFEQHSITGGLKWNF